MKIYLRYWKKNLINDHYFSGVKVSRSLFNRQKIIPLYIETYFNLKSFLLLVINNFTL